MSKVTFNKSGTETVAVQCETNCSLCACHSKFYCISSLACNSSVAMLLYFV